MDSNTSLSSDIHMVQEAMKIQADELNKMTHIHDQLVKRDEEVARLKMELQRSNVAGGGSVLPAFNSPDKVNYSLIFYSIIYQIWKRKTKFLYMLQLYWLPPYNFLILLKF